MRPDTLHVGGTLYWVIRTRDPDTPVLKDADATPTVAVRKNGASTGDSVTIAKRSATTGLYDCSYNPAAEVEGDVFELEERAQVTGTTTAQAYYDSGFSVKIIAVERGTDSAALASGVNVTQLGGDTQSLTDLKDFADAGYDPSTNKVQGVVLTDVLTTYTGNTPQTGDNYAVVSHITYGNSALKTLIDTLTGYVDTEVAAIKAKTDNLPSDPADASDIASSFSTVNSTLSTIAAYIDTEVAAIKAKTDNLPSDPADASDIAASFSSIASTLATIAAYIDTEVAAIKAKTDNLPSDPADQSAVEAAITAATSPLATAANLATVAGYIDTEVSAIKTKTDQMVFGETNSLNVNVIHYNGTLQGNGDLPAKLDAIKDVTNKIDTGLVLDGVVWQFTVNMLEAAIAEVPKYGDIQRHAQEAYNTTSKTVDVTVTKVT